MFVRRELPGKTSLLFFDPPGTVKEERGSDVYVEQGRELSIARLFASVDYENDGSNTEQSVKSSFVNESIVLLDDPELM